MAAIKVNPSDSRAFTNGLYEAAEEGVLDWEMVAKACLHWMSEDDVRGMCENQGDIEGVVGTDLDDEDDE